MLAVDVTLVCMTRCVVMVLSISQLATLAVRVNLSWLMEPRWVNCLLLKVALEREAADDERIKYQINF